VLGVQMRKRGKSVGRRVITSSRLMSLLPTIGVAAALIGGIGFILGIVTIATGSEPLIGVALLVLGLGQILAGVVLFLAMCVLQDLLGIL